MIERNQLEQLLDLAPKQESENMQMRQAMLLFVSQGVVDGNPGINTIVLPSQERVQSLEQISDNVALIGAFVKRSGLFGLTRTPYLARIISDGLPKHAYDSQVMNFTNYILNQNGDDLQIRDENMAFLEKHDLPLFVIGFWRDPVRSDNTFATLSFPGGFSPAYARDKMIQAVGGSK